jgi:hypothetical protein
MTIEIHAGDTEIERITIEGDTIINLDYVAAALSVSSH